MVSVICCLAAWTGPWVGLPAAALARMRLRWCQVANCSTGCATWRGSGASFPWIQVSKRAR